MAKKEEVSIEAVLAALEKEFGEKMEKLLIYFCKWEERLKKLEQNLEDKEKKLYDEQLKFEEEKEEFEKEKATANFFSENVRPVSSLNQIPDELLLSGSQLPPSNPDSIPKTTVCENLKEVKPSTSKQYMIAVKASEPEYFFKVYQWVWNKKEEMEKENKRFYPIMIDDAISELQSKIDKTQGDIETLGIWTVEEKTEEVFKATFKMRAMQVALADIRSAFKNGTLPLDKKLSLKEVSAVVKK
ncbi:MAG: hypothetical protein PHD51_04450 [Patescibacteria group bacterium]|nr:hypothetical protein [Patescibacteria group bacterium]MDD5490767.1 hypothetical protein [Patescibacteria group bacterium]